ncbi:uncharacterized protein [Nicotiana tomentosiformis]|uniref:uncharacterized protein n=1 Tax=Nicotiana tomentosiformis TaxID=4098 RepID=UPI00388CDE51
MDDKIKEEIMKQLRAYVVRSVRYTTWVENVEHVPKKDGKTKVCVDYRDLNKASPKDNFPLPNIHILIDNCAKHAIQTFVNCYAGYHQILMVEDDVEKTAFTTPWGTYYYKVKPFGLKNAGETYMRVMTTIFHDMMHKKIKVYVNDIIIKSKTQADHMRDLKMFFERLRRYDLKLNPAKCVFGFCLGSSPVLYSAGEKLRHYLLAYTTFLVSRMDPLKYIFQNTMSTERLAKWEILLTEINIVYVTHIAIKAQALADHLTENPVDDDYEPLSAYFPDEEEYPEHSKGDKKSTIRQLAGGFFQNGEILYKRTLDLNLLRCIDATEADQIMSEMHSGVCGPHMNGYVLAKKILRVGYYWLTMERDCFGFVHKCYQSQIHGDLIQSPSSELHSMSSPWPFIAWGMDAIWTIEPKASNGHRFILVAIDYFTK